MNKQLPIQYQCETLCLRTQQLILSSLVKECLQSSAYVYLYRRNGYHLSYRPGTCTYNTNRCQFGHTKPHTYIHNRPELQNCSGSTGNDKYNCTACMNIFLLYKLSEYGNLRDMSQDDNDTWSSLHRTWNTRIVQHTAVAGGQSFIKDTEDVSAVGHRSNF